MSSLTRSPLSLLSRIQSTLTTVQARRSYPRNHYYLCYASLLALLLCHCYDAYHLLASLPNCHVKPLTHHCPSKPLIGYVTALLSPLIALLVEGDVEDCHMMDIIMLGYHNISYLINASIYLVKGGRLDLMPGVLFHSCRPSFRHTG